MTLLEASAGRPTRDLATGDVLVEHGQPPGPLHVLRRGALAVTVDGSRVATISRPGAMIGELSILLGVPATATVTATQPTRVHVIDDPSTFLTASPDALLDVCRELAARLARLTGYLVDVRRQYGDQSGHLGMVDEVLSTLAAGAGPAIEIGSERDPDPYY